MLHRRACRPGRFVQAVLVLVVILMPLFGAQASRAQTAEEDAPPPVTIDMALVPVPASAYVEDGFQMLQAGYVDGGALQAFLGNGEPVDDDDWAPIGDSLRRSYTTIQGLLSDRGDAYSDPIATVNTAVIELSSDDDAVDAEAAARTVLDAEDTEEFDGIEVYEDQQGIIGTATTGEFLVVVQYDFSAQSHALQQNTDWTPEVIAGLVKDTVHRLEGARESATEDGPLGLANLLVYGPQAGWSQAWANYPTTQHYRVLDGQLTPYGGELSSDLENAAPEGIEDMFVSRQVFDDDRYGYVIDVTLATFDSNADARAFADDPAGVAFPATWTFEAEYSERSPAVDGLTFERARVDDETLRATGYRTIQRSGTVVEVVQMLASGDGRVTSDAAGKFTQIQLDCLEALPAPCAPIPQDLLGLAFDEADSDGTPEVTPGLTGDNVLASAQFGWRIPLPDDGWEITGIEFEQNVEFFELQSGRSMITVESAMDHHGDPQQCVLGNLALLEEFEDRAVIDLGTDDPDERPAGREAGHAWAVYTVEPLQEERADQEYVIRIDCYTLVEGESSLVVTHRAPRDLWTTEREKGNRFREAIELPATNTSARITLPEGDRRDTGRTQAMGIPRIWIPLAA